jgi:hypothetical protein
MPIESEQWDDEDSASNEQDVIAYQIAYYPADFTLKGYVDKYDFGQLIIPEFQRSYVWDQVKASKLIESFLLGLPVPGVFLYKERQTNKLLVIDGQQRILSVVQFLKNTFGGKIFRLKNVSPKWQGKTYEELDQADQYQLSDTVLRATVVQQLDPEDDSSIYYIFERLNTGGVNLNPMEIRKCVYSSDFFSHLEELNKFEQWRALIGSVNIDKRLKDVELILRILALSSDFDPSKNQFKSYKKPMKKFLNDFMLKYKRMNEKKPEEAKKEMQNQAESFRSACTRIYDAVGEKPFHVRGGRLNFSVLDSVMAATIACPAMAGDSFKRAFEELNADTDFIDATTRNTSDDATLEKRFIKASSYISL